MNAEYCEQQLKTRHLFDLAKELQDKSLEKVEIWAKPGGDPDAFEAFKGFYKVADNAWVCHSNERGCNDFHDMDDARAEIQIDYWSRAAGVRAVSR